MEKSREIFLAAVRAFSLGSCLTPNPSPNNPAQPQNPERTRGTPKSQPEDINMAQLRVSYAFASLPHAVA
jgi:hypothetical protein